MLIEWLLAGWKVKLGLAVWLGMAAGGLWKRKAIGRRGLLPTATSVCVFCIVTVVLAAVLARRVLEYRRIVKESGIEYTITEGAPERIRAAPPLKLNSRDWPCWRSLTFDNHSRSEAAPVTWGPEQNVIWRAAVPGRGHSSPILCGQFLFLTTADEERQTQMLLAYDRDDGRLLWERVIHQGRFAPQHAKNTYASATPACDGTHVYTTFAVDNTVYLSAIDLSGEVVWQHSLGRYESPHGYCASPLLYRSVVIATMEGEIVRRLAAFDRTNGALQWQTDFNYAAKNQASPVIAAGPAADLIILPGVRSIRGFDPESGKALWSFDWGVNSAASSAAVCNRRVFAGGTVPQNELVCFGLHSTGPRELWRVSAGVPKVPTPLAMDAYLFVITDNGVAECLNSETGQRLGRRRLGGDFSSSPVLAAGRIYSASEDGHVFVIAADPKLEFLAVNNMEEPIFATPVIVERRLYLRTVTALYCIGSDESP